MSFNVFSEAIFPAVLGRDTLWPHVEVINPMDGARVGLGDVVYGPGFEGPEPLGTLFKVTADSVLPSKATALIQRPDNTLRVMPLTVRWRHPKVAPRRPGNRLGFLPI